jgi:hypothetical protein
MAPEINDRWRTMEAPMRGFDEAIDGTVNRARAIELEGAFKRTSTHSDRCILGLVPAAHGDIETPQSLEVAGVFIVSCRSRWCDRLHAT